MPDKKPVGAVETIKRQLKPLEFSDWKPNPKDVREDGSMKGLGFLGPLKRPDGGISSEVSVGVDFGKGEMNIPTMVPGLKRHEIDYILSTPEHKLQETDPEMYKSILDKAVAHAKMRLQSGKGVFADLEESPKTPPVLE